MCARRSGRVTRGKGSKHACRYCEDDLAVGKRHREDMSVYFEVVLKTEKAQAVKSSIARHYEESISVRED